MATNKPEPRNLANEMGSLLPVLTDLARLQQQQYIAGQKQLYDYQMGRLPQDYPLMMGLQRTEQLKERQGAIDFLRNYGPAALEALYASSPALAERLEQINALASATRETPEMTRLLDEQALEGLRAGGTLTPDEERAAQQSARAAYQARGMVMGKPAALAEVLNRDVYARARQQERQAFAAGREAGNRQFVQSATQIADAVNPGMRIMGMPTGAAQGMGNQMGFIQGVRTPDPGTMMGAGLQYGSDLYNTNLNMQASMYNSARNNQAGLQSAAMQAGAARDAGMMGMLGAGLGAAGSIAGGFASSAAGSALISAGIGSVVAF